MPSASLLRSLSRALAMKSTTLVLIAIAAIISVVFVNTLKPTSTKAFIFFSVWLTLPYIIMSAALIFLDCKGKASFYWYVVGVVVSVSGILFLANVIFWHPDAQGAIAVLMTPILQGGVLAFLLTIWYWVSRNSRN